jgi:Flp pilus assembly protein TadD
MFAKRLLFIAVVSVCVAWLVPKAQGKDLRITLPKRSEATPVQRLNRDGVQAIQKHQYEKAKALFYKAYLFDPDDPFTLNNLGYVSELEGQVDRAQRFYELAARQTSDAVIDRASSRRLEGSTVGTAIGQLQDRTMQINAANLEAIRLLSEGRASEADSLLKETLKKDEKNAFTLNNLGVAKEMEGEFDAALKYYAAVVGTHSDERVVVTLQSGWRGKPITEMAADSAKKLRERKETEKSVAARVAWLNLRGVSALNRNDWGDARQYLKQSYALDPENAFSLNNLGYLAEKDGDFETAQEFYEKARTAEGANLPVGVATRRSAEGRPLLEVADDGDRKIETRIAHRQEARHRQKEPIHLRRRDNTPVTVPPEENPSPDPSQIIPNQTIQPH